MEAANRDNDNQQEPALLQPAPLGEKVDRQERALSKEEEERLFEALKSRLASQYDNDLYQRVRDNFHTIEDGMSSERVAELIGEPNSGSTSSRWEYKFFNTSMADEHRFWVVFDEGKVVDKAGLAKHKAH